MGTIPDDIKSGLQNLAKSKKVETKNLFEELKEIIANDETIKSMPVEQEEFKIRYAWALLCRRHTAVGTTNELYLQLLSKSRISKTKAGKSRIDIYAKIKKISEDEEGNSIVDETSIASGTLWEKAAEAAGKISKEKIYKVSLTTREVKCQQGNSKWTGYELSGNEATFIETNEIKMPSNEEFYKSFIEPLEKDIKIDLDEGDLNNRQNKIDIRVVKGMIIDNPTGTRADGTEFGRYSLTDDSLLGGGDNGKAGNVNFWIHPEEVILEKGVTIKSVVTTTFNKEKNKINWQYFFSIPVGTIVKRKIEVKPVSKPTESVNVDDLDEEDIQTETKKELLDDDFAV